MKMYEYRNLTPEEKQEIVAQRLAKGYPPHQPAHPVQDAVIYLVTAACYEHRHLMQPEHRRQEMCEQIMTLAEEFKLDLRAWVVLTNHYHLLTYVETFESIPKFCQRLHGRLSHQWNGEDNERGRKVWYRYHDRAMRSEGHYYATLNHIHYNPVKHGLVESPYLHVESSVHWYLESFGRDWLRDVWVRYPVKQFGEGWDDYE